MPVRARDSAQTKAAILAAARLRFASDGFERTTIRSIAAAADVDPALVMHYFGNKDALFREAADLHLDLPDLSDVPPDRVADALLPLFIRAWSPDGPLLSLLRAAASNQAAAQALLAVFADQVAPALSAVVPDRAPERAALVAAQLIGIAVSRFILRTPALTTLSDEDLICWLRPVLAHYLTDPMAGDPPSRRD